MLLLLAHLAAAAETTEPTPAPNDAELPSRIPSGRTLCGGPELVAGVVGDEQPAEPEAPAEPAAADRIPTGRSYSQTLPPLPAGVVGKTWRDVLTPEEQVALASGVVMDRFGTVLESHGATPVLYIDGVRVMTGLRR